MLTGYQCQVVAFVGDGYIICPECAYERGVEAGDEDTRAKAELGLKNALDLSPMIEYTASSEFGDEGLYCEDCHAQIVEPWDGE